MVQLVPRDLWKAKKRISSLASYTPLLYSEPLSRQLESHIYLKLENDQPTGAFKLRGAANKILSLSDKEKKQGIATFSTGNHGIAVAYVGQQMGIKATVCISNRVPQEKVNRLKRLGAEVKIVGSSQDDAEEYCYQLEKEQGINIIKPFDDLEIIAGQGTIGLELMEQCPDLEQVIVPLSGGGLLSGVGFALKNIDPSIQVTGVSMEQSAVMYESLKQGSPIVMQEAETLADSLLGGLGRSNQYTFTMTREYMDEGVLVPETSIARGMLTLMDLHKMVVEGAAAAGIGWLLEQKSLRNQHIAVIVSGNNVDHQTIEQVIKTS
ncbi:hydroxyectoine utilization dehydratase EutB [Halobacillus salinarum]|uniref:Hydroxyectoine utilization dehydratase EutB n=1 Tax=Halobacillus salinarum TaxID=2932257 RepID=A0ABY4EKV5_9BACI|nr:hydroxyectoine utilization dehydratase EutB [Halobacillus salinarum]UOQ45096.1 hydroxyectoine utilization dehydratase EutB [Halobacillus salinarum]